MKISFVVAVYQNEGALSKTYEKILSIFSNILARYEYEIVSEHEEDNYMNSLKERSDYLDKYLNI